MRMMKVLATCLSLAAVSGVTSIAVANPSTNAASVPAQVVTGGPPTSSAIPTVTPPAEQPAVVGEDTRKVCRQRDTMGTRLRAVRVCRTVAEWRVQDNAGRARAKTLTEQRPDGLRDPRMGGG